MRRTAGEVQQGATRGGGGEPQGPEKKPYEPPRVVAREPLEAVAAVCAPVPPAKRNAVTCRNGPSRS